MEKLNSCKKLLAVGIAGGLMTMIGDFLLMGVSTFEAQSTVESIILMSRKIGYTRIGLAAFFGYIGIPVCGAGYYALCIMCTDKDIRLYRIYRNSLIAFSVLGGGIHVICCFIVTVLKKNLETGSAGMDEAILTVKELLPDSEITDYFYTSNLKKADADAWLNGIKF